LIIITDKKSYDYKRKGEKKKRVGKIENKKKEQRQEMCSLSIQLSSSISNKINSL